MRTQIDPVTVEHGLLDGPWELAFWVELPFAARSKSNHRQGTSAWGSLARFEDDVAATVAPLVPDGWEIGSPLDPVAQRPPVVSVVAARTLLDAANLSKSLLDALEGVLYVTDAQVAGSMNAAERGTRDQWLSVAFAQLPVGATLPDVVAATAELAVVWQAARTAALG